MSYATGRRAAMLLKQAVRVEISPREAPPIPSFMDRLILGRQELAPATAADHDDWQRVGDYMTASAPQLRSTRVFSGNTRPGKLVNQVYQGKDQDTFIEDLGGTRDMVGLQYAQMHPELLGHFPASYHPYANSVILNERSPGALVHELGHGVDLAPRDDQSRMRRYLRWNLKPTLWKELSAWKKGRKAYQRGFAASPEVDDPEARKKYEETMHSYNARKYPAYGTYLGGAVGAGLGGLAGALLFRELAKTRSGHPPLESLVGPASLGSIAGGTLGVFGGGLLGKLFASARKNPNARKALRQLDKARSRPDLEKVRARLAELRAERAREQEQEQSGESPAVAA